MRRPILAGIAIAFVVALVPAAATAATIPPPPYTTAEACLACHAVQNDGPVISRVDFVVGPVDRDTACRSCHWPAAGTHPFHNAGMTCGGCHTGWGDVNGSAIPSYDSTGGGFFAASSQNVDAATLHKIHANPRWPGGVRIVAGELVNGIAAGATSYCGSCHAAAACSACHAGAVPHGDHTYDAATASRTATPWVGTTGAGTPEGDQGVDTAVASQVTCSASTCHAPPTGAGALVVENTSLSLVKVGTWRTLTDPRLSGGNAMYTNTTLPGVSVSYTFTMPSAAEVSYLGYRLAGGGFAYVSIDGVQIATVSLYAPTQTGSTELYRFAVGPGTHTVTVSSSGLRGAGSGYQVNLDAFGVYPTTSAGFVPACTSCHADRESEHGYTAFDHTSDETDTTEPLLGGAACVSCHSMDLSTAHAPVGGCEVCHSPVSAGSTLTAEGTINPDHTPGRWDQTCEACHNAGNEVLRADKHAGLTSHEASGVAADAECLGCHGAKGSTLPSIHASAETTVDVSGAPARLTACDVCHGNPTLTRPLTNVCSSCHFTMDAHPGADHTSAYSMVGCNASGCHDSVTVVSSTETTEDLVAIHGDFRTFACSECHESASERVKAAIATGDKACTACHDAAGNHAAAHVLDPPLVDADGPHYAYGTGSAAGGTYTEDCALCHTSSLIDEHMGGNGRAARFRPDGTALTCADCHASSDLNVQLVIQRGSAELPDFAACDDCHVSAGGTPIHQQIPAAHLSRFGGAATEGTADLTAAHTPVTVTPPGGTALNGCAVCHSYFTKYDTPVSQMGTRTQTAIARGVAACEACHTGSMMGARHAAPDSASCTKCHTEPVTALHAASKLGGCSVCHNNPLDPDKVTGKTDADCTQSGCHTTEGTDYHTRMDLRHTSPTNATCFRAGCHDVSKDLRAVHEGYAGPGAEFSQYDDACDMCHTNARIDWTKPVSAGCVDACHSIPNHMRMKTKHAPTSASDACTSCHGTDIVAGHDAYADLTNCDRCHADPKANWNRSIDCGTCHSVKFPPESQHYSDTTHTAVPFTASSQGTTIAAGGEECANCHSPILPVAHSAAATDGAQLSCVGCHEDRRYGSLAFAFASWPTKTCRACHDAPTAPSTTHDGYGTAHLVVANGCAGSGFGCHVSTDLAVLHGNSQNGGAARYSGCYNADPTDPTACHASRDTRPAALDLTNSCGAGSTGCHTDKSAATHGAHTLNVTASDYDDATISGCTDSGAGCHAAETRPQPSYQAPYHPDTSCTGACHSSAGFATHSDPLACGDCHDGTYADAPNVKELTAPSSAGGHYDETTHTVLAADLTGAMGSGGTVTAKCTDCHPNAPGSGLKQLYAQHQNVASSSVAPAGDLTCVDCHSYSPAVARVVTSTVGAVSCGACHNATAMPANAQHASTAPVVGATSADGCGGSGTGCHDTNDLHALHKGETGGKVTTCALAGCHDAAHAGVKPTAKSCGSGGACHTDKSPYGSGHYPAAPHTAASADLTGTVSSGGTATARCVDCHANDTAAGPKQLYAQHQGLPAPYGDTSCKDCHDYGTGVTAQVTSSWTSRTCAACHNGTDMPGLVQHATAAPVVTGSSADGCGNSGTACHGTYDLHALHKGRTGGTVASCNIAGCHDFGKEALKPGGKSCGTGGACHNSGDPHPPHVPGTPSAGCLVSGCHDKDPAGAAAPNGDLMVLHAGRVEGKCDVCHSNPTRGDLTTGKTTFDCQQSGCHGDVTTNHKAMHETAGAVDAGCRGCHFANLVDEHSALGYTCGTCHSSTNASVIAAIARSGITCDGCHPAVNGKDRHTGQNTTEFVAENASGHRVYETLPWMRTSFTVNGATYTWPVPANFFKTGWTSTSVVTCDKCHTFSTAAAGPHGAAVAVNVDPAYTADWHTATLNNGTTSNSLLCNKCHNLNVNDVHNAGDHDGYLCVDCHARVPHGWRLPRLLAYTTDPIAYKSNHLTSIKLKSYSPSNWSESDCGQSGCEEHNSLVTPKWPSTAMTVAQIAGRVTDSSTATGVPGATVTLDTGRTATTNGTGYYLFEGLGTGTYTLTASANGYSSQSGTVDVTASDDYLKDFALVEGIAETNVALDKTANASSQYSSSYGAAMAIDGSTSTYWRSSSTGSQNLTVDLGGVFDLDKAVVDWNPSYYARAYTVQVSRDNTTWTTVATVSSNSSGMDTHTFTARARYIRLACTSAYSSSYRVNEFQAFGVQAPTGTISGTVTSGGSPVSGATVSGDGLTATTDAGGGYAIAGVLEGTYSLTASKAGYATSSAQSVTVAGSRTSTADFALALPPANAARTGTFSASASNSSFPSSRAGDGSYSTYWQSPNVSYNNRNQWLQVDLGSAKAIDRIVVGWNNSSYYARSYQVQYATSASGPWTTVPNGTVSSSSSSSNRTFDFATVTARYWRAYCTYNNSSGGYRIYEFEAWTP